MIRRETLHGYRAVVGKYSYYPTVERERQLIDSHLEALNEIDRLKAEIAAKPTELAPLSTSAPDLPRLITGAEMADLPLGATVTDSEEEVWSLCEFGWRGENGGLYTSAINLENERGALLLMHVPD